MKNKLSVLDISLHNKPIGTLTRLPDDRNIFSFNEEYIDNPTRPTLSLSFKDDLGGLITQVAITKTRLQAFFANLLPEGFMRTYLASHAKLKPSGEFFLLAALGNDLPGAIKAGSLTSLSTSPLKKSPIEELVDENALHFSLTGLQLKFSAIWENNGSLTIPLQGTGGSWIIKLPSPTFAAVPQNEYAIMDLARQIGIHVPKTALVKLDQINGIPSDIERFGSCAFVIERFDRSKNGELIHIEDFAQIFAVYPDRKYSAASYGNIAEVIWAEVGNTGLSEFIRRLVFTILIGNGDMHLKNWSLIYPDKINPQLAPAYDFVSTIPYLSGDTLALNFMGVKSFQAITLETFEKFAAHSRLPKKLVIDTLLDTVNRFALAWESSGTNLTEDTVREPILRHLKTLPLWRLRC
jgi:serine/threonine-protein kinase HipA